MYQNFALDSDSLKLKEMIIKSYLKNSLDTDILGPRTFVFDFRSASLNSEFIELFCKIFFKTYGNRKRLVIGGLEVGAVPFISSLVLYSKRVNLDIKAFIFRKEYKNRGLGKNIEGYIPQKDDFVVVIDDTLATGDSVAYQISQLNKYNVSPSSVFCIVGYLDNQYYTNYLNVPIVKTMFELSDFKDVIDIDIERSRFTNLTNRIPQTLNVHSEVRLSESNKSFYKKNKLQKIGDRFIFTCDTSRVVSIDKDLNVEEIYTRGFNYSFNRIVHSLSYKDNIILFERNGSKMCINKKGKVLWKHSFVNSILVEPVIVKDSVVCAEYTGIFYRKHVLLSRRVSDGDANWHISIDGDITCICEENGIIYCATVSGLIFHIDAISGKQINVSKLNLDTGDYVVDVKLNKHNLIVLTNKGSLLNGEHSLNLKEIIYNKSVLIDNKILCFTYNGNVFCIDSDNLKILWHRSIMGKIIYPGYVFDSKLIVASLSGFINIYEINSGMICAKYLIDRYLATNVFFQNNKFYFVDSDSNFCVVNIKKELPQNRLG